MTKKKSVKKSATKPKDSVIKKPKVSKEEIEIKLQPVLVENFVALQKVMINLSTKFEKLNTQLSTLLNTFEMAAKTLAKKDFKIGEEENEKVTSELKELKEQNKILAKGLNMLHQDEKEQKQMLSTPNMAPVVPRELEPPKQVPVQKETLESPKPKMTSFPPLPKLGAPTQSKEGEYQKSEEDKSQQPSQ